MVVTSDRRATLVQDQDYDQFLARTHDVLAQQPHLPTIVSIQFPMPRVEPLALMALETDLAQPHCYWEQPQDPLAILAVGSVVEIHTQGADRFSQAQAQLQQHQATILSLTYSDLLTPTRPTSAPQPPWTPQWFASFTFFEEAQPHSPFSPGWLWLPQWQVSCHHHTCHLILNQPYTLDTLPQTPLALDTWLRPLWNQYRLLYDRATTLSPKPRHRPPAQTSSLHTQPNFWGNLGKFYQGVQDILGAIATTSLQKVVLAHTLEVNALEPFFLPQCLENLRQRYPNCYLFCWVNPQGEAFLGASPERLLSLHQGHLQTEALAGSAPLGPTSHETQHMGHALLSNPKELHEHQLVVDFILSQLIDLGLNPQQTQATQIRQLSQIQHLHTPIIAHLPPELHPLMVLGKLHPTPAVAGVPRFLACEHIRAQEEGDRSLYAAPLGWIDGSGNCEFIVGIRSAFLQGTRARLMAGAGIVQGSTPDREVAEIQLKLQTMLQSL